MIIIRIIKTVVFSTILLTLSYPALSLPTKAGFEQLKQDEGFTPRATFLVTQSGLLETVRTIGYGYNIDSAKDPVGDLLLSGVCEGDVEMVLSGSIPITREQADNLFLMSVLRAFDSANRVVDGFMDLDREIQDVLVNMAFQLGATGLARFQKMLDALREEDYNKMALELLRSRMAEEQASDRAERLAIQIRGGVGE